jgi:branched-chain amino acid transport system ATP-binding protein
MSAVDTVPHLQVTGLSVHFGGVFAVSDVDLTLPAGQVAAIIGPNGAGKTTLLNAVSGLVSYEGLVRLRGEVLPSRPVAVARQGVGRSFQDPRLLENASAVENLMCGLHLLAGHSLLDQLVRPGRTARGERAGRARATELLRSAGLSDLRESTVAGMPYGVRKLLDICRAVLGATSLLLLDEPSSGLSMDGQLVVQELIERQREAGMTVLVVEHHLDLVRAVADQVIGMQAGGVLLTGTPAEVLDSDHFLAAVTGQAPLPTDDDRAAAAEEVGR